MGSALITRFRTMLGATVSTFFSQAYLQVLQSRRVLRDGAGLVAGQDPQHPDQQREVSPVAARGAGGASSPALPLNRARPCVAAVTASANPGAGTGTEAVAWWWSRGLRLFYGCSYMVHLSGLAGLAELQARDLWFSVDASTYSPWGGAVSYTIWPLQTIE